MVTVLVAIGLVVPSAGCGGKDEPQRHAREGLQQAQLRAVEFGLPLLDERLDPLVEVVRLLEEAVGEALELEPDVERTVVHRVEHALRHRERER